jgi:hypothetical protein
MHEPLSENAKVLRDAFHRLATWHCPPAFMYAAFREERSGS